MKKLIISLSICLLGVNIGNAQVPFQMHYESPIPVDADHYSIETAEEGAPYAYACAGTYFDVGSPAERFHVFTVDEYGVILWEKYLDAAKGRILDVTVGKDFSVAVTGYVQNSSNRELYFAMYDATGNLMGDLIYESYQTNNLNSAGNNIYFSEPHDMFIVGGFQNDPSASTLTGNAIYMGIDANNPQISWVQQLKFPCLNVEMSSINDMTAVGEYIFMTGKIDLVLNAGYTGNSHVLGLLIDPSNSGAQVQDLSFSPTPHLSQQAMGTSVLFDENTHMLHLMYNVSNSLTHDENRPYFQNFQFDASSGTIQPLAGLRIEDQMITPFPGFGTNPNITGLKLIPHAENETHYFTGIMEKYGSSNDAAYSFFQEVDLINNVLVGNARFVNNSNVTPGLTSLGGLFSFISSATLNTDVYTPENATLSKDGQFIVSIIPAESNNGNTFTFDISSTTINIGSINNADCVPSFQLNDTDHALYEMLCSESVDAEDSHWNPHLELIDNTSDINVNCSYFFYKPSGGTSNVANPINFKIYPNPAFETLNFNIFDEESYTLEITNLNGQTVYTSEMAFEGSFNRIDISDLHSGVYFLKATSTDGSFEIEKFIKD